MLVLTVQPVTRV